MTIVWPALVLGLLGGTLLWLSGRARSADRTGRAVAALIAGGTLVAAALFSLGVWIWANTATDSSQFARALLWGDSDTGDIERFPSVPIYAGDEPLRFVAGDGSAVESFRLDGSGDPFIESLAGYDTNAFLVLQHDELIFEDYYGGEDHDDLHTSFSMAKSFVATLVAIADEEGHIGGLDDSITDYLPELEQRDDRFGDITIRHLLAMSSGLAFDDGWSPWADPANTYYATDLRGSALAKTAVEMAPGEVWHYNDWNTVLLGLIVERSTGERVSEYLATRVWQPVGAEADASWSIDSEQGDFEKSFVGVNARPIDYLKLGWLYLNDGSNGSEQIVPAEFVEAATAVDLTVNGIERYQYQWWVDADRDGFFAAGDHCQFMYVHPPSDSVIFRDGSSCGDVDWPEALGELAQWLEAEMDR